ncbi:hypothetical protein [Streptomyces solaniscabiei]|uniref:hypothetical protein n=1 Tax=Streptomyces solaniscabiei TaxID=2683255 RepID=UPI001CE2763A|nr:hypothetical protein [Streptomyces solaniscabiei]
MADEQDGWLDRETAEILLRGESLKAVDPAVRDRAERLAETLDALAAYPAPTSGELPGEAAALAAFRKARADDAAEWAGGPAGVGHGAATTPSDAGLVRIGPRRDDAGRARWGRPLRLGLAAALTAGMVGGVAVAAGTGVLPTPFGGTGPDPAATVSAAATSDRPLGSPTPLDGLRGGSTPDGATPGPSRSGATRDEAGGGTAADRDPEDRASDGAAGDRRELATSCRDVSAGKALDGARRRALTEAAGGTARVGTYCRSVLAGTGATTRDRTGGGAGKTEEGAPGGTAGDGEPRKSTGGTSDSGGKNGNAGKSDNDGKSGNDGKSDKGDKGGQGEKGGNGKQGGGKQGDDGGDEGEDGPHIAPRAHGAPALRPAHATGAPAALLPLPDLRPKHAPQELQSLGNTA